MKTTIIGIKTPPEVQMLLSALDGIEFIELQHNSQIPDNSVFELTCPDRIEDCDFVIPPKRAVPHYRELEVSKKKGKRRNY